MESTDLPPFPGDAPGYPGAEDDGSLLTGMGDNDLMANYAPEDLAAMQRQTQDLRDALQNPKQQLDDLKKQIQSRENKAILGADHVRELLAKINDLQKLVGKKGTNPDELQDRISQLSDQISEAIDEGKTDREDQINALKDTIQSLTDQVHHSKLPTDQKDNLTSQLDTLNDALKRQDVDLDATKNSIDSIKKDINKAVKLDALAHGFDDIPGHISNEGFAHERTQELASGVRDAIKSGDWTAVKTYLTDKKDNHSNEANNMIQQFVGTIYYSLANQDEDKLNEFLSMIPKDIRDLMADACVAHHDERQSNENCDTPAHKQEFQYYGTPDATADRLRSDRIDSSQDNFGDDPGPDFSGSGSSTPHP